MVDLKARPFYLNDEDIAWVNSTIASMTDAEKVGQLFVHMITSREPAELKRILDTYHVGAFRYINASPAELHAQNTFVQANSKIPLLIASNCEQGGSGGMKGGTYVANAAQCGASCTEQTAYDMGYVGGVEAQAIGCNWNFSPVVDVLKNWRNTIVNTRAFSNDSDEVIKLALQFMKGLGNSNVAACAKHFPGDGIEERDQHLLMGVNDLSCEDWDNVFGKVYKALIAADLPSIMIGHICQPAYTRKFNPGIADADILPATLSREIVTDLLRGQLGFNGLVLTDASHMIGMWEHMPRHQQLPAAINAGIDMILFLNDLDEDFGYMMDAYKSGIVSESRIQEALTRILGMKASRGLHKLQAQGKLVPPAAGLNAVGCERHLQIAEQAAEDAITLVKDTRHQLPISPERYPRIRLYYLCGDMGGFMDADDSACSIIIEELERAGFQVTLNDGASRMKGTMAEYHASCDAALVFADVSGYARENVKRIVWKTPQSNEVPWYGCEVPTAFVSLNYTTHLCDVPMCRTYINAYGNTRIIIRKAIEKLTGKSEFHGHYNENVWCGKWDTRL